jgi:hypothetical protein
MNENDTAEEGAQKQEQAHEHEEDFPLPPASFEFLIFSLKTQAEMHLGMAFFGEDEKDRPKPNFRLAKHALDLLAMLQGKTKGNVTLEEQRLLENSLTELRFRYVQLFEESQKK